MTLGKKRRAAKPRAMLLLAAALMVALLASWGGTAAVAALALRHSIGARPQLPDARRLLQLGLPLAPAIAATCIADFVNRAYLYRTAGAVAAGEFSVALRFGSVAALMVAGFQLAWQPRAYALGRGDAALRHIALDGIDGELTSVGAQRRDLLAALRGRDLFGEKCTPTAELRSQAGILRARAAGLRSEKRRLAGGGQVRA